VQRPVKVSFSLSATRGGEIEVASRFRRRSARLRASMQHNYSIEPTLNGAGRAAAATPKIFLCRLFSGRPAAEHNVRTRSIGKQRPLLCRPKRELFVCCLGYVGARQRADRAKTLACRFFSGASPVQNESGPHYICQRLGGAPGRLAHRTTSTRRSTMSKPQGVPPSGSQMQ